MLEFLGSLLFAALIIYLAPSLIAVSRNVRGWVDVVLINLLGGWTVIGWFWALYLAINNPTRAEFNRRYGLPDD
jgi:hypothetical protein